MARQQVALTSVQARVSPGDAVDLELTVDGAPLIALWYRAAHPDTAAGLGTFTLPRDAEVLRITGSAKLGGQTIQVDQRHPIVDLGDATWHIHDPGAPLIERIQSLDDFMMEFRDAGDDSDALFEARFVGDALRADLERTERKIGHRYPRALHDFLQFEYATWGPELWYPSAVWAQPFTVADWLRHYDVPQEAMARLGVHGALYARSFGTVHWDTTGGNLRVVGWLPGDLDRIEAYQLGLFPDALGPGPDGLWFAAYDDDMVRPDFMLHLDGRAMSAEESLLQMIRQLMLEQIDEMVAFGVFGDVADGYVAMDSAGPAGRLWLFPREVEGRPGLGLVLR